MRRTRAVTFTALAAVGALVLAACGGTPGQQTSSSAAPAESSAAATSSGAETSAAGGGGGNAELPGAENVGKVGGSGCGIPHGPWEEPATTGGDVRVSWNDPPLSFNNNTTHANSTASANIQYFTNPGFTYYDQDLNLINNDQFGTCEIVSLDPLTIKYTVNEGVTWSDGVPVTAADIVLSWGAQSGNFNTEEAQLDEEGNLLPSAGVAFDKVDPSLSLITEFPEIGDDGRSATFTWSQFYIDYPTASPVNNGAAGTLIPAHVVGAKALNVTDPAQASEAVITAFQNKDQAALKPIADFWNTGFDADQLPSDPSLYLATGPYKVTSYQQRASITLERNQNQTWGPQPAFDKVTYTIIGDPTAAVQALTNEETDIISPQATADIYQAVSGLADRGVEVQGGDGGTYEHVDLVFANGGPFDPAKYGGDAEKALKVRQAFLKTIPRTEILDRLIKPINPEAVLRGSFVYVPGAPGYDQVVAVNGMDAFDQVDIEGAKALLQEAGVTTPIDVRLLFADNNPRRSNEYDLMKASATQAGFNIIDSRSPSWGTLLPTISGYDASLFGWNNTSTGIAESQANYVTDGANNYGKYSNPDVDALFQKITSQDVSDEEFVTAIGEIETQLVEDAFGVVIYQHPAVTAWNATKVVNVGDIPLSPNVLYNYWEWEPAA